MKTTVKIILFILISIQLSFAQYSTINIGILPFYDLDKKNKRSELPVSELSDELSKYKFIKLVERSKLKEVLKEIELGMTGTVDDKTASKAGKLHGIQIMIAGTLRRNKITARAIHTESGKVIASHSVSGISKMEILSKKLASGIEAFLARENLKSLRNNSPDVRLDFWLKKRNNEKIYNGQTGKMKIGESVAFQFKADQDGYLTIVDIQPDGNVVILFPNDMDKDNRIYKGKFYSIPAKDDEYEITVTKPAGRDTVVAFFTKRKVDWLDRELLTSGKFWTVREYERFNLTRGFKITSTKLKKTEWESKALEIDVVK